MPIRRTALTRGVGRRTGKTLVDYMVRVRLDLESRRPDSHIVTR